MFLGTFNNFKLIQNLASYHESIPNSVVLLYDPVQTAAGHLTLRAFRLSDDFLELSKRCAPLHTPRLVVLEGRVLSERHCAGANTHRARAKRLSAAPSSFFCDDDPYFTSTDD